MKTQFLVEMVVVDGVVSSVEVCSSGTGNLVQAYYAPTSRKELLKTMRMLGRYGKVQLVDSKGRDLGPVGKIVGASASGSTQAHMHVGPGAGFNGFEPPVETHWETLVVRTGKGLVEEVALA
jgi:hypothetical protein